MEIRIIVLLLILTSGLTIAQASDTIIKPIKKEFFPLEVGNKYIYEIKTRRKVLRYDTVEIIVKFKLGNYTGFGFKNDVTYFMKGDSIYQKYPHQSGQSFGYNLLYYQTYRDSEYPYFIGDCVITTVYSSYLKTYKIGNKIYKNCFKFSFNNGEWPSAVIIAYGIGIIQTIKNGEFRNLIAIDLK